MYYTKYIAHNKSLTFCKYLAIVDLFLLHWQPSRLCSALWMSVYVSLMPSSAPAWRLLEGRDHICLFCIVVGTELCTWSFVFIWSCCCCWFSLCISPLSCLHIDLIFWSILSLWNPEVELTVESPARPGVRLPLKALLGLTPPQGANQ